MKLFIVLAGLLAVCIAQQASYPYSSYLDKAGNFLMRWDIKSEQKDIEIQLVVKTKGWVSLLIGTEDGYHADVIVGGYNDETKFGYVQDMFTNLAAGLTHDTPVVDDSADVILQSASYDAKSNLTTLTFKRSIYTGDSQDAAIRPGPLLVGWAYSDTDDVTSAHTAEGFITLTIIPA